MYSEHSTAPSVTHPLLPFFMERTKKGTPAKRKVLIVDDDVEMAEVLKDALQEQKEFEVKVASDPYEAIQMLLDEVYDFLLLDWNLPRLNGLKTILEAEKIFHHDPALPLDWESRKVGVVTFSGDPNDECKLPTTRHFKYLGHVSKRSGFEEILEGMQHYFNRTLLAARLAS